jgi:spore germination cell wall hydrolase CwlJ-like protein
MTIRSLICAIPLVLAVVAAEGGDPPNTEPTRTDCLAAGIYQEARGEPLQGKLAVAQTIMNRGTNICKTINQPGQFSWRTNNRLYYDDYHYRLATTILTRNYAIKGFQATHFHNLQVDPNWSGYITTIGNHKFYQL